MLEDRVTPAGTLSNVATPGLLVIGGSTTYNGQPQPFPTSNVTVTAPGMSGVGGGFLPPGLFNNSGGPAAPSSGSAAPPAGLLSYTYDGSPAAPTLAGSYIVDVTFTPYDLTDFAAVTGQATWNIRPAPPTVAVLDAGGTYIGAEFPAAATVAGVDGVPASTLENHSLTFDYQQLNAGGQVIADLGAAPPSTVGNYEVTASFPGSRDYTTASASTTFSIGQATPTVQVISDTTTFNGSPQAFPLGDVSVSGPTAVSGSFSFTYNGSPTVPTHAGTYAVEATFTPNDSMDYTSATGQASWTINPAPPAVSVSDAGGTFTGNAFPATATVAGVDGVAGSSLEQRGLTLDYQQLNLGGQVIADLGMWPPTTAGSYEVTASFPGSSDYLEASKTATFSIGQATPMVEAVGDSTTYDGVPQAYPENDVTVTGPASSTPAGTLSCTYNGSTTVPTAAGTYQVVVTFTPADATDFTAATGHAIWVIHKAKPTVGVASALTTYIGNAQPFPSGEVSVSGADGLSVNQGALSYTYNGSSVAPTHAGTYSVLATFTPADATDFTTATGEATWIIHPALPVVTMTAASTTYDGNPQAFPDGAVTVLGPGGLNATDGTLSFTYDGSPFPPTHSGNYVVAATFTPADAVDFSASTSTTPADLTIEPGTPTVNLAAAATYVAAGSTWSPTFDFTNPDAHATVHVAFSDGAQETFNPSSTASSFTLDHSFASAQPSSVTVTVSDEEGDHSAPIIVNVVVYQATIDGAPATSPETSPITLQSTDTDPSISCNWSVTDDGNQTGFAGNGPVFSFTPQSVGSYAVTLTEATQGSSSTATATIDVTNVAPVVDVGSSPTLISTGTTWTRTVGFTSPDAAWTVYVDFGDGTTEAFPLPPSGGTPDFQNFNAAAQTFTLEHSYATAETYNVTVRLTDNEGGQSSPVSFLVSVFDPQEAADTTSFAVAVAGSAGTATAQVASPTGNVRLGATIANGAPGDTVSVTLYSSNPVSDRSDISGPDTSGTIPTSTGTQNAGSAVPVAFIDTRVQASANASVTLTYDFVVPDALAHTNLELFWWNATLHLWDQVDTGSDSGVTITEIDDANGNPTGMSDVHFTRTYGPNTIPSISQLNGTVFSVAVPVSAGPSSSSAVIIVPATAVATTGPAPDTSVEIRTTGFGSASSLSLPLQESQSGLSLSTAGAAISTVGETEPGTGITNTGPGFLQQLMDPEVWRARTPLNAPQVPGPNAPPQQQQPPPVDGNGLALRHALDVVFAESAGGLDRSGMHLQVSMAASGKLHCFLAAGTALVGALAAPPARRRLARKAKRKRWMGGRPPWSAGATS